ncbi:MAG: TonB-dependent receptor domain-containing protein, partial [Vicinamibacterales bacterium]
MRASAIRFLPLAATVLLLSQSAFAQVTTATLYGIVRDSSGSMLPGATVTLLNEETGASRTTATDSAGEFGLTALPVGTYMLKIELQGFKAHVHRGLQLVSGQVARQTFQLDIGTMAESVVVEGVAPLVKTASSEQMETLGTLQVAELPLARRNITGLLRLAPGVDPTGGHRGVRFNGVGKHGAGITVDGTDANSNPEGRGVSQYGGENYIDIMSIEAIQEVQLAKGVLSAEYGGVVGGQVNLISKSGSNRFRGSLFENYQGEQLNARDIFLPRTSEKPPVKFNQFGGSLGGPIIRSKAFFFTTYEGYREDASARVQGTVPTQQLRSQILAALPFPETRIVLDTLPLPTEPRNDDVGFFVGTRTRHRDENHFVAMTVTSVVYIGTLSVTYTRMRPFALIPRLNVDGANDREFRHKQDRIASNFVLTRGMWVSETRFGWNASDMERVDLFFEVMDPSRSETNIWGRRMGQISVSGLFSTPSTETWDMEGTAYTFDQKLSRAAGQHLFKMGVRWARQTGSRSNPENPVFAYQNKADLLANIPREVRPTFGAPPHESHLDEFGGFIQDDWRLHDRLVLNLGLRYDYYATVKLEPTTDIPVQIVNLAAPTDLRTMDFGQPLDPLTPYEPDGWVNLGPRAGFAWTMDDTRETVLRGGVGVLYSPQMPAVVRQGAAHPIVPFRTSWTRTEALARGLGWPSYNDDLREVVEREAGGNPFFFSLLDPNLQNPYTVQSMINVQRALGRTLMAEVGYVRVDGRKFLLQRLFNLAIDRETGARPNPALGAPGGYYVDNGQTSEYNA